MVHVAEQTVPGLAFLNIMKMADGSTVKSLTIHHISWHFPQFLNILKVRTGMGSQRRQNNANLSVCMKRGIM
jgi:hypothetical protein